MGRKTICQMLDRPGPDESGMKDKIMKQSVDLVSGKALRI